MDYWKRYDIPGGDTLYKLVNCAGSPDDIYISPDDEKPGEVNTDEIEGRLYKNVNRAKNKIENYALVNPWDWFATFTISPKNFDRSDLDGFYKKFSQFIRNSRRLYNADIAYLLVPELHGDGENWHMHGLLKMPVEILERYKFDIHLPQDIKEAIKNNDGGVYRWKKYEKKFGWNSFVKIRSHEKASRYITKYLRKSWMLTADKIAGYKHLYYISRGLEEPKKEPPTPDEARRLQIDFHGEYKHCNITWFRVSSRKNESD